MSEVNVEIKIEDNSDKFKQALQDKMPELLNAMGNELYKSIYDYMTQDKIVDTGRLRGSISYSTPYNDYNNPMSANKPSDFVKGAKVKDSIVYGSNVEYANFVELGTSKQRARHYIKNGTYRAVPRMKKVVEIILKEE